MKKCNLASMSGLKINQCGAYQYYQSAAASNAMAYQSAKKISMKKAMARSNNVKYSESAAKAAAQTMKQRRKLFRKLSAAGEPGYQWRIGQLWR
jgi:hypothetical protein